MSDAFPLSLTCLRSGLTSRLEVLDKRYVFRPNERSDGNQDYMQLSTLVIVPAATTSSDLIVSPLFCGLLVLNSLYPITVHGITTVTLPSVSTNSWQLKNTSFLTLASVPSSRAGYISSLTLAYENAVLVNGTYPDNEVEIFLVNTVAT